MAASGCCGEPITPTNDPWRWISTAQLIDTTVSRLVPSIPHDIVGVVGVPRSGMLPAAAIATHLHLPLYELNGSIRQIGAGGRARKIPSRSAGQLLVVDDTVYSGGAMKAARKRVQDAPAIFAAVYVRPEAAGVVDVFGEFLPSPHLLEWNFFNSGPFTGRAADPRLRGGVAVDFDGVLCADPPMDDSDTDPGRTAYGDWLTNAPPLHIPRHSPVKLIVTYRLERWRAATEAWLQRWGIRWERLEMWPGDSVASRDWNAAAHKGRLFRESGCAMFIESDARQAADIFQVAKKPVLSLANGRIHQ